MNKPAFYSIFMQLFIKKGVFAAESFIYNSSKKVCFFCKLLCSKLVISMLRGIAGGHIVRAF
jgi:hypothetical protein